MTILILAYNKFSASAKMLKQTLLNLNTESAVRIVGAETWMGWTPSYKKQFLLKNKINLILNWGCKDHVFMNTQYPENTQIANLTTTGLQNKLDFFRHLTSGANKVSGWLPMWTTEPTKVVSDILASNGENTWVGRKYTNASGGAGIKFYTAQNYMDIKNVDGAWPLYTQYIQKRDEYRVHFIQKHGDVEPELYWQKKKLLKTSGQLYNSMSTEDKAKSEMYKIRNLDHGWVFSGNIDYDTLPVKVIKCANAVIKKIVSIQNSSHLKFGAIDLIYNSKQNSAYALECNSAPGLCEPTAKFYAQEFLSA